MNSARPVTISFQLPDQLQVQLERELGDLPRAAKQALAIEGYRAGAFSLGHLAEGLGISTYEAEGLLKQRGIYLEQSEEELAAERAMLSRVLGQ
jgi:predicted HTH domain antitoxin